MAIKFLAVFALVVLEGKVAFASVLDIDRNRYPDIPDYGPQVRIPWVHRILLSSLPHFGSPDLGWLLTWNR